MTRKKKFLMIISALGLLLAVALAFLWTNLDWIVKSAIERYGSQATGTRVHVDRVALHPVQGKGAIEGLTVANPPGYSAAHILSLGAISVRIEPGSFASNTVVIDDIRVMSPLVVYEMNDARVANVDVLKKHLVADQLEKPVTGGKKSPKEQVKRLRILHLAVEKAKVEVRIAALGHRPQIVALSRLEMTDIGGKNGAPPEEVAKQIVTAILSEVTREVGKTGASRLIENALERALKRK